MGGGVASRIPSILASCLPGVRVVIRTYDFDPAVAWPTILSWYEECRPDIVVGESMGANYALRLPSVPVVLVSPALGVPRIMSFFSPLASLPFVAAALDRKYGRNEEGRQRIRFGRKVMSAWKDFVSLDEVTAKPFAFFGSRDTFRRSSVVSVRAFERRFGKDSYMVYEGTHFMEDNNVRNLLVPYILRTLEDRIP